jgi:hypothetical protein
MAIEQVEPPHEPSEEALAYVTSSLQNRQTLQDLRRADKGHAGKSDWPLTKAGLQVGDKAFQNGGRTTTEARHHRCHTRGKSNALSKPER